MKNIIPLILTSFLVMSCSFAPPYDENEYLLLVDIRLSIYSINKQCQNKYLDIESAQALKNNTHRFLLYTEHQPKSDEVYYISTVLDNDAAQLLKVFEEEPNHIYCMRKTKLMAAKADALMEVLPEKERFK